MKHIYQLYQIIKDINKTQISLPQFLSLSFIADNGNVTARKLADYLRITPAGMTQHLDALENDSHIQRVASKDDRRQTILRITETGMAQLTVWKDGLKQLSL